MLGMVFCPYFRVSIRVVLKIQCFTLGVATLRTLPVAGCPPVSMTSCGGLSLVRLPWPMRRANIAALRFIYRNCIEWIDRLVVNIV
jgi:hypothetical protein